MANSTDNDPIPGTSDNNLFKPLVLDERRASSRERIEEALKDLRDREARWAMLRKVITGLKYEGRLRINACAPLEEHLTEVRKTIIAARDVLWTVDDPDSINPISSAETFLKSFEDSAPLRLREDKDFETLRDDVHKLQLENRTEVSSLEASAITNGLKSAIAELQQTQSQSQSWPEKLFFQKNEDMADRIVLERLMESRGAILTAQDYLNAAGEGASLVLAEDFLDFLKRKFLRSEENISSQPPTDVGASVPLTSLQDSAMNVSKWSTSGQLGDLEGSVRSSTDSPIPDMTERRGGKQPDYGRVAPSINFDDDDEIDEIDETVSQYASSIRPLLRKGKEPQYQSALGTVAENDTETGRQLHQVLSILSDDNKQQSTKLKEILDTVPGINKKSFEQSDLGKELRQFCKKNNFTFPENAYKSLKEFSATRDIALSSAQNPDRLVNAGKLLQAKTRDTTGYHYLTENAAVAWAGSLSEVVDSLFPKSEFSKNIVALEKNIELKLEKSTSALKAQQNTHISGAAQIGMRIQRDGYHQELRRYSECSTTYRSLLAATVAFQNEVKTPTLDEARKRELEKNLNQVLKNDATKFINAFLDKNRQPVSLQDALRTLRLDQSLSFMPRGSGSGYGICGPADEMPKGITEVAPKTKGSLLGQGLSLTGIAKKAGFMSKSTKLGESPFVQEEESNLTMRYQDRGYQLIRAEAGKAFGTLIGIRTDGNYVCEVLSPADKPQKIQIVAQSQFRGPKPQKEHLWQLLEPRESAA